MPHITINKMIKSRNASSIYFRVILLLIFISGGLHIFAQKSSEKYNLYPILCLSGDVYKPRLISANVFTDSLFEFVPNGPCNRTIVLYDPKRPVKLPRLKEITWIYISKKAYNGSTDSMIAYTIYFTYYKSIKHKVKAKRYIGVRGGSVMVLFRFDHELNRWVFHKEIWQH